MKKTIVFILLLFAGFLYGRIPRWYDMTKFKPGLSIKAFRKVFPVSIVVRKNYAAGSLQRLKDKVLIEAQRKWLGESRASASFVKGNYMITAFIVFYDSKLKSVSYLIKGNCSALHKKLLRIYGSAENRNFQDVDFCNVWRKKNSVVVYLYKNNLARLNIGKVFFTK